MSATGRGPRLGGPDDFYVTPSWCVDRLLDVWTPPSAGNFCEPAAGDGAIIKAVNKRLGKRDWLAIECRATAAQAIREAGAEPVIADFLTWQPASTDQTAAVSWLITNPPYSLCEQFIRRAHQLFTYAPLVFLVRLGFLASEQRLALWRDVGTPDVFVLPNRPSFTGNGTDSADYAWIVIGNAPGGFGKFRVLNTTPLAERKTKGDRNG